ncbi:tetracycline resistance MFS efflux pump [Bartonella taylorii]|uniref:Multidrug resistance protein n=1 Tax=Bartonella taylorii 8TBB TaxID=1094560 RepID=A0A9P2RZJ4_BARTA|nr:tetracycline resistance MFS efflux pump [Bartonella taylorii]EJF94549.1 multidrug resistance protein [Bartonella taylorii 8TBB]USP01532.1 tetracycline resistance MFS efflux pump [Bartonella taylorii]
MHAINDKTLNPKLIRRGLLLVFITLLLDIVGTVIVNPILPEYFALLMGDDIRKSSIEGGKLLAAYSAMQFLFAPAIGNLSDRYGRRPILLISLISFMIGHFICAIAWSYPILFIGRLLSGVSGAGLAVCMAYIADISDDKTRTRNFGLLGIASGLGFILGSFIGGFLGQFGPRTPFYFSAGFSLIIFIFVWAMLPETLPIQNRRCFNIKRANPLGALWELRQYPMVIWVLLVFFLYWFAESVWPSIWAFISKERYGWNSLSIGLSYSVFGVGQIIVVALILPYLSKRWSNWCIVMVGLLFALVGELGYAFATQGWMVYVVFVCTMCEYLVQAPMRAIASAQVPPNVQGELQGAMTSVISLGLIFGSIFYMLLFERFTQKGMAFYFSGAPFLGSFCMLIVTTIVFALRVR